MDCAKGINFLLTNGGRMQDYWGVGKAKLPMLPMIAVPTTAGTGSESQSFALISDAETHVKMACGDKKAAFKVALLDPVLTLTQPPPRHRAHRHRRDRPCVGIVRDDETERRVVGVQPRGLAVVGAEFSGGVASARRHGGRSGMQLGACFAGLAIENSMLGAAHALANPLTAEYGIPHGQAIGLMLPHVVRFNGQVVADQYLELLEATGGAEGFPDPRSGVVGLAEFVAGMVVAAKLPIRLRDCQVVEGTAAAVGRIRGRTVDGNVQSTSRRSRGTAGDLRTGLLAYGQADKHTGKVERQRASGRMPSGATCSAGGGSMKRRLRVAWWMVAMMALAGPTLVGGEAAEPTDDWPLFRGDAHATGVARGTLPDKLDVLWKFAVPGTAFDSTPAIVDGVVYLGDMDGRIYALDLATGEKRWEEKFEDGFLAGPAVKDDALYVGDMAGRFYCLDAKTGKSRLGLHDAGRNRLECEFLQGPCDRRFAGRDALLPATRGRKACLEVLDRRPDPLFTDDRRESRFVAGCDSKLHVVDLDNGQEVAAVEIESPTGVTPAVRGDLVYFGTEAGTFFAVNWKTAAVAWTFLARQGKSAVPQFARRDLGRGRVWRTQQASACARTGDGQAGVGIHGEEPHRWFARDRRQPRVRRRRGRPVVRVRRQDGQARLAIRGGRRLQRLARRVPRTAGDRQR